MALNKKHCLLFLLIFVILLLSMSAASATEVKDANNTQEIIDNNKLSTPANYDVDNMVQAEDSMTNSVANVKNENTSDYKDNSDTTNRQSETTNNTKKTNDNDIISKNISKQYNQVFKTAGEQSFTQLADLIISAQTSVVNLPENTIYKYVDSDSLYIDGIPIDTSITINGNGVTIDGSNKARIFNITADNVTIANITLTNGNSSYVAGSRDGNGGAIRWEANNGSLENATLINNHADSSGGALFWDGHNGTIVNSTFEDNQALGVHNGTDEILGMYGGDGGAVLWYGSNGTVDNVTFNNNIAAYRGGAIFIEKAPDEDECKNITVRNSRFDSNEAGTNGGAIDWNKNSADGILENSNFTNNRANRSAGAVYWSGNNGTINNVRFINNNATNITETDGRNTTYYTTAGGNGGAVVWVGNIGLIDNSTFEGNNASVHGGAVFLIRSHYITFHNSTFSLNKAKYNGGAIDFNIGATFGTIDNCTFTDNVADRSGGAVFWNGHNGTIKYSIFEGNNATGEVNGTVLATGVLWGGDGGAINWLGSNGTVEHSIFKNNNATFRGGAIFVQKADDEDHCTNTSVEYCNFTSNYAGTNGGALDWNSGAEDGRVEYCNFTDNLADRSAGAIYWSGTNGTVTDSKFINNTATGKTTNDSRTPNPDYYPSNPGNGGAIVWIGTLGLVDNSTFEENVAKVHGGAVYLRNSHEMTFHNTTFRKNLAGSNGGAVDFNFGASEGNITNCTFTDNLANRSGGAVYWHGHNGTINTTIFINNTATGVENGTEASGLLYGGDGGAVMWTGSEGYVDNSTFLNNTAAYRGGAIFLQKPEGEEFCDNITVENSNFRNNFAGNIGGAITWFEGASNGDVINSNFTNNTANFCGGAVYWSGESGRIQDSSFENNTAWGKERDAHGRLFDPNDDGGHGGAIAFIGNNSIIYNNTFNNNSANQSGGALFLKDNTNVTIQLCLFNYNTVFKNHTNESQCGGAVAVYEGAKSISILDSEFNFNKVIGFTNSTNGYFFGDGGAVYFGDGCLWGVIDNSTFTNNSAKANGGAIRWDGNFGEITNNKYYNNSAAYSGGALRLSGNDIIVDNSVFEENKDSYNNFKGNYAWGSAIYVQGTRANITNSNFTKNVNAEKGAVYVDGNEAFLGNIIFVENNATVGGALYIRGNNTDVNNAVFNNSKSLANASALFIEGNNASIYNSVFNNNDVKGNGTIFILGNNTELYYNNMTGNKLTSGNGGAIYVDGTNTLISHMNIDKHSANYGGSIYVDGVDTTIEYSQITGSTSTNDGGAIYIHGENTIISNSNIANNTGSMGGSIYIDGNLATITRSNITDSKTTGTANTNVGGAIYIHGNDTIISRSDIARNNASVGGSIYIDGHRTMITRSSVTDSKTTGTSNTNVGGAIYIKGNETLISYSDITYNNATQGGSIYIDGHYSTITSSNVTDSIANTGGGIYVKGSNTTITDSDISFNTAKNGQAGAVYVTGSNTTISYSSINNNTASSFGGALALYGGNTSVLYSNLESNYASNHGGAIYLKGDGVGYKIQGCNFYNDSVKFTIQSTNSYFGGAIFIQGTQNTDNKIQILDNTFNNCSAYKGGAINFYTTENGTFDNCTFIECMAGSDGGAIYGGDTSGSKNCTLSNSTFIGCYSWKNGGSLVWSSYNGTVINNQFINSSTNSHLYPLDPERNESNTAGAILLETCSNSQLINNTFVNSYARCDGGALVFRNNKDANNISVINCTFINATAGNSGGAVNCFVKDNQFINCTFSNCSATNGGAICTNKILNISNTTFKDNVATNNGGAIYINASGSNINDTNITNNNATKGSGIYLNDGTLNLNNVKLLENQAKADSIVKIKEDIDTVLIKGTFKGNDNVLNGIWKAGGTVNYNDVTYLGSTGITTGSGTGSSSVNEVYQTIIMEVYSEDNTLLYAESTRTDAQGNYQFEFDPNQFPDLYAFKIYHPEDNYYTYLAHGIVLNVTKITLTLCNNTFTPTYSHYESINVTVTGNNGQPQGYVTVYLNSTLSGFKNYTFRGQIDSNGFISFDGNSLSEEGDKPLNYLNASVYEVLAIYEGQVHKYLPENKTSTFIIYKAESPVTMDIENYTYNGTSQIQVSVPNKLGEGIYSGEVVVNIYSEEMYWGKPVFNETYRVPLVNTNTSYTDFLPILDAGNYYITAHFSGTQNYLESVSYKNLTVFKAESTINITTYNVTSLEDSIINVHIDPENSTGTVNISIIGSSGYEVDLTDVPLTDSVATTNLGKLPEGTYIVTVDYGGDKNHHGNSNYTLFKVVNPVFTVDMQLSNMTYTENRTFTITVPKDYTGELKLYINDILIPDTNYTIVDGIITLNTANLTDFITDGKLVVGEYNLSVNYTASANDKYLSRNASALFNVFRAEPTINVNTVNITYGFNETITVNLTSYNASGKVNITVYNASGDEVDHNYSVTLTNQTGIVWVLNDYSKLVPGFYTVKVEYCNDTNYLNTTLTGEFKIIKPIIAIGVDRHSIFVDEYVTLLGTVTDGYDRIIKEGTVKLTVYDSSGQLYKEYTVLVNESGLYEGNQPYYDSGTYTANATYMLNGIEIATSINNVEFVVNKIHTITNVTVLNNTVSTVTIDVVVTENETATQTPYGTTSTKNNIISSGTIRVWVNGQSHDFTLNGANTTIVLNVSPVDINTTEELPFKVEYLENTKYINSTGINSTTGEEIRSITAEPIGSNLTVTVDYDPQRIGQNVTIEGHVFTDIHNEIKTGKVNITIVNDTGVVYEIGLVDLTDNGYSAKLNTTNVGLGTFTVVVKYLGNKTSDAANAKWIIFNSTNSTTFSVVKIPTTTNVTILNSTAGNVTLNVTVAGEDGNTSMTGKVNITIAGNPNPIPVELVDGNVIVELKDNITATGLVYVNAVYNGNDRYLSSIGNISETEVFTNVTVTKQVPLISVEVNVTTAVVGDTVYISGNLTDEFGNNLTDRYVDIYVNGSYIGTRKTNSTGGYNITYTTVISGEMIVNATFEGDTGSNAKYDRVTNHTSFEVIKLNTTVELNVSNINYTQHELINITINETEARGDVIVEVNRTSDNSNVFTDTYSFDGSIIQVDLSGLAAGEYNVTVSYVGDTRFNGNFTNKTFTVHKLADYELNISAVNITYGDVETITVIPPVNATGNVKITITGTSIQDEDVPIIDGKAELNLTKYSLPANDDYEVVVTFEDSNYGLLSNATRFNIAKASSSVDVGAVNITHGYNETITVTLPEYEHATGNISVIIYDSDNNPVESYIIECPGNLTGDHNITIIQGLANDTYTVRVNFTNDTNYNSSVASTTFTVSMPSITIYESQTIFVDESAVIRGVVRDVNNNVLEGSVIVRIDGHNDIIITPEEYEHGISQTFTESGVYNANATYVLFGQEVFTSENIVITVNRIPTITTVEVLNDTFGNVLIDVKVTENATGYARSITSGTINLTINGETIQRSIAGSNTTINITDKIITTGNIGVDVVYNGSVKYVNSTGRTISDVDRIFDHIVVNPKASNMTIIVNPESVKINESITITGEVFDEYGNPILSGEVNISVDGQEGVIVPINSGTYTLNDNRNTTYNGTIDVQVTYLGQKDINNNIIISQSTNRTTYNVEKLPTITTVEVLNSTAGKITIDVRVKVDNSIKDAIKEGKLNITVAGIQYQYPYNVNDENVTIILSDIDEFKDYLKNGNVTVTVTFDETTIFRSSNGIDNDGNIFKNITITPQNVNITVAANLTHTSIGEHVNITGNLTDGMNQRIGKANVYLNITGNDALITVTTNDNGEYSYDYIARIDGTITVNATFTDNTAYYNNATDTCTFTVDKIATVTNIVEVLSNKTGNVTLRINVTNKNAELVTQGRVNVINATTGDILGTGIIDGGYVNITLYDVTTPGEINVNVTYLENDIYLSSNAKAYPEGSAGPENTTKILVTTDPTIAIALSSDDVTIGDAVIVGVNVTDIYGNKITTGTVPVSINGSVMQAVYNSTSEQFEVVYTAVTAGNIIINATHPTATDLVSENKALTINKIPTNTSVEILDTTIINVTLAINVTNATGNLVTTGEIIIRNTTGGIIAGGELIGGKLVLTIPVDVSGRLELIVSYPENELYYSSYAKNNTEGTAENITVINVSKIPTKTNVTIVNNTIGNVVIHVNVTNMTDDLVSKGHVKVYDNITGLLIGEGDLVNGGQNITLNVTTPGPIGINVTYIENDIYYASNARDSGKTPGSPDENTTEFNVLQKLSNIDINIIKDDVIIGEEIFIYGFLTDEEGHLINTGNVNVTINNTNYTRPIVNGKYNITYTTTVGGQFTANATYLGNTNISSSTSKNVTFTVNKIPTNTSVIIINNTIDNVTIEVSVTNATGSPVNTGYVVVNNATQLNIVNGSVNNGKVILTIPSNGNATLKVNVTYIENDYYLPSNARNSSTPIGSEDENVTIIDIAKHNATITIMVNPNNVTIGENITISGEVKDANGTTINQGEVILLINNEKHTAPIIGGTYSFNYTTSEIGTFTVNATYAGSSIINEVTSSNENYNVNKMATNTTIDIINATVGSVTIRVNVTNTTGERDPVGVGKFTVYLNGTAVNVTDIEVSGNNVIVKLDDIVADGTYYVSVHYDENDLYLGSDAKNYDEIGKPYENLVPITVSKIPTNTGVKVMNHSVDNITLEVSVVNNYTGSLVENGSVRIVNASNVDQVFGTVEFGTSEHPVGIANVTLSGISAGGEVRVYVIYDENTKYLSSVALNDSALSSEDRNVTVIGVDKLSTVTSIVEVLSNRTGNVTLRVNVTNATGDLVPFGTVNVTDALTGAVLGSGTVVDGIVNITLTGVTTPGEINVNVTYVENDVYLSSNAKAYPEGSAGPENTTKILVTTDPTIAIALSSDDVTIGDAVIVGVNVTDIYGDKITTGTVNVTINGEIKEAVYNSTSEQFEVAYTADTAGNIIINATHPTATDLVSDNVTLTVNKKPTNTVVTIVNNTAGNVLINVTVSDENNNPITDGLLEVTVAGKTVQVPVNGTTTPIKLNITTVGDVQLSVKYLETDEYLNSTGINNDTGSTLENITTVKQVSSITVTATPNNTTVGETVTITGNLTVDGEAIGGAYVEVTIDGISYIVKTDASGSYTITNVTTHNGTVDVIVNLEGNGTITDATANTNFTVNKIQTTTLVEVTNNTVGNVSIGVIVKDENNNTVTSGKLNITTPEQSIIVDVTGDVTPIELNITSTGVIPVTVKYIENDVYINSTGLDKASYDKDPDNADTFNNITVNKQNTTITVNVTSPVKAGNSTIISGILVDEQNKPISGAKVEVKVNDTIVGTVTTDSNGLYTLTFNDTIVGTHNVTCNYGGNDTFIGSEETTNFTVEKVDSKITLDPIENVPVGNDVNITGKLEDEFGNPINNATINVTIGDTTITTRTDSNGRYNVTYPTTEVGVKNVTVVYSGDDKYTGDEVNGTLEVNKIHGTVTIEVPKNATTNTPVNITGVITDDNGKTIPYLPVNVTVNNVTYPTITDENGTYKVPVDNIIGGQNNVTVTAGNDSYDIDPAEENFNVRKLNTTITLNPINDVVVGANASITGKLIDENNTPVRNATIRITVNNTEYYTTTDSEGNYEVKVPTYTVAMEPVLVEFDGNDYYNGDNTEGILNVIKQKGIINVELPENATPNEIVNITGNVTDENGNPIPNLPVNVTVNNVTYPTITDENGTYTVPVNNVEIGTNNVTVTAGNDTIETEPVKDHFDVEKIKTIISINPIDETIIGENATITGNLTDKDGNPIAGAEITVTVDGISQNVTTGKDGKYTATFTTDNVGSFPVLVDYKGNGTYEPSNTADVLDVVKQTGVINVDVPENVTPGTTVNITGNVTDENGNPIAYLPVNVTVNNVTYPVVTDENGTFTVPVNNTVPGTNNVTITSGNGTIQTEPVKDTFVGRKLNTTVTIDSISDVVVGKPVNITGTLLDEDGKPIAGAEVTVTVDGVPQKVKTDKNGKYTAKFPTSSVGDKPVTVEYTGNDKYNGANADDDINVVKNNGTITLKLPSDAKVGDPTNITGVIKDKDGNPVPNMPVNVTVNNKTYPAITDKDGNFKVEVNNVVEGKNNVTATAAGNDKININNATGKFDASRKDATLTLDPIADAKMGDNVTITGNLVDEQNKPIPNAQVNVTVNGETYTVRTDANGNYKLTVSDVVEGLNNVTVSFNSKEYNTPSKNTTFEATKLKTKVTVPSISGIVGEDITLTAYVTDENGNPVTGGNLVFKLNGRTLREDGRFDTNNTKSMKFKVVNGVVTYTMKADLYLRAGKNITASYSGSYKYESAKGNVAEANIKKRTAQIEVEVIPNPAKQNTDVVFSATLTDITKNATNATCLTTDGYVIFKINGKTLKDDKGKEIQVPADHSVVNYVYHIPTGTGGVDENGVKNYTVEAVYANPVYYPDTRNTTVYNVERSIVNINFIKASVSNDKLSVKATLTDYENNYLVGKNKICVKINGKTYKENGKVKYFTVSNGKVDLTGIKLSSGTKVKSVMIVTGDRQAYLSSRATTYEITTS